VPSKKAKAKPVRSPSVLPPNWRDLATLPLDQARLLFNLSRNAAYEAARRGEIPAFRIGKVWRVPVPKLRQMFGEGNPTTTPQADLARALRAHAALVEGKPVSQQPDTDTPEAA
jgi:hypothetical protein